MSLYPTAWERFLEFMAEYGLAILVLLMTAPIVIITIMDIAKR